MRLAYPGFDPQSTYMIQELFFLVESQVIVLTRGKGIMNMRIVGWNIEVFQLHLVLVSASSGWHIFFAFFDAQATRIVLLISYVNCMRDIYFN